MRASTCQGNNQGGIAKCGLRCPEITGNSVVFCPFWRLLSGTAPIFSGFRLWGWVVAIATVGGLWGDWRISLTERASVPRTQTDAGTWQLLRVAGLRASREKGPARPGPGHLEHFRAQAKGGCAAGAQRGGCEADATERLLTARQSAGNPEGAEAGAECQERARRGRGLATLNLTVDAGWRGLSVGVVDTTVATLRKDGVAVRRGEGVAAAGGAVRSGPNGGSRVRRAIEPGAARRLRGGMLDIRTRRAANWRAWRAALDWAEQQPIRLRVMAHPRS